MCIIDFCWKNYNLKENKNIIISILFFKNYKIDNKNEKERGHAKGESLLETWTAKLIEQRGQKKEKEKITSGETKTTATQNQPLLVRSQKYLTAASSGCTEPPVKSGVRTKWG